MSKNTFTPGETYFIMTSNGLDGTLSVASFGPFKDLSNAKLAAAMLQKKGSKCGVYTEQYARECDEIGTHNLIAKNPNGSQW